MKSTLFTILILIVVLALGGVLGYRLNGILPFEAGAPSVERSEKINLSFLLSSEKSGLLDNVGVQLRGWVDKIDDKTLVLRPAEGAKSLEITIDPEMRIFVGQLTRIKSVGEVREGDVVEIPLANVKTGDQVTVNCILTADVCKLSALVVESEVKVEE